MIDPFPPGVINALWFGIAAGALLGLLFGSLLFQGILPIEGREMLFSMTPFTFHAFWVFAGIAAGLFIGVPSRAAIAGHPLHPMLIPFPIAFFVGAFLTDLAYWSTGDPFWARASFWLVAAGLVGGALAAVLGLIDFLSIPRVREHTSGWIHFIGNATVLVLSLISLILRWDDPAAAILPWGLTISAVVAGFLVITGWYGGELAYRHKIGVIGHKGH